MDLEECVLITDSTLIHLAMGCPRLENLVSGWILSVEILSSLWKVGCNVHEKHDVISKLQKYLKRELLTLRYYHFISTYIYVYLFDKKKTKKKRNSNLILKIDNSMIFCLQSLSHCELITDDGIRHLGMSPCASEHLTVLELDNCPLITDTSLEHLISCHNLQRIELYDCQLITRAGIRRLRVSVDVMIDQTRGCSSSGQSTRLEEQKMSCISSWEGNKCIRSVTLQW